MVLAIVWLKWGERGWAPAPKFSRSRAWNDVGERIEWARCAIESHFFHFPRNLETNTRTHFHPLLYQMRLIRVYWLKMHRISCSSRINLSKTDYWSIRRQFTCTLFHKSIKYTFLSRSSSFKHYNCITSVNNDLSTIKHSWNGCTISYLSKLYWSVNDVVWRCFSSNVISVIPTTGSRHRCFSLVTLWVLIPRFDPH